MNHEFEALINATGWTLVHSLWQGLLIALVVGLLLVILRQRNPVLRHGVLVVGLLLFPAAAISTFVFCWDPYVLAAGTSAELATHPATLGFFERVVAPSFPYLVALWLVGSLLLVLRTLIGYGLAQYMVRRNAVPADAHWQARLHTLMELMDIRRGVRILISHRIDVPMVMGHAKPVILLPISVMSGLPYAEVEAILLHELAHVKRNDYLLNLLQTGLEAIFFYHPGCWWMSARLRSERELCCDDLAIAVTRDPLTFAKALAHLEEVHMKIPFGAMAANGRGALFKRIERLMRPTVRTGPREALTTAALILVGGLIFLHFTGLAMAKPEQDTKAAAKTPALVDLNYLKPFTDEAGNGGITLNDEKLRLRIRNGKIDSFTVNGEARPYEELEAYKPRIQQLLQERKEIDAQRDLRRAQRMADAQARDAKAAKQAPAARASLSFKPMPPQDQEPVRREEKPSPQAKVHQQLEAAQEQERAARDRAAHDRAAHELAARELADHELAARDRAARAAQLEDKLRAAAERDQQRAMEQEEVSNQSVQLQLEKRMEQKEKEAAARAAARVITKRVIAETENLKAVQEHLKDEVRKNKIEQKQLEYELKTKEFYRDHRERNGQFHNPVSEVQTKQAAYYVQLDEVAKLKRMVAELSAKNHELTQQLREVREIEANQPEAPESTPSPEANEDQQRPALAAPAPKLAPVAPAPKALVQASTETVAPRPAQPVRAGSAVLAPVATPKPATAPSPTTATAPVLAERPQAEEFSPKIAPAAPAEPTPRPRKQ